MIPAKAFVKASLVGGREMLLVTEKLCGKGGDRLRRLRKNIVTRITMKDQE
jgi:hypothetical protein